MICQDRLGTNVTKAEQLKQKPNGVSLHAEIGWKFIEGGAGHTGCTGEMTTAGQPQCDLTYAALASPDGTEFSMVIVSLANSTEEEQVHDLRARRLRVLKEQPRGAVGGHGPHAL
eukprot:COSAG06_NODE_7069_length_2647_cov_4.568681_6_plen_114_part_01